MKYLRTHIFNTFLTLALLLMLTIPAFAVSVPFYDVTLDTPLYECTTYLSERGITNGTGNGRFSPEAPITTSQWAIMLCRAYGVETKGNSWSELSRSAVEQSYRRGWLSETAIFTLNTQLCRGTLYKSAFAAAGIPVYDSVLYEDSVALPDYENCIRIGKELQLCGEGDDANEIVTRGETAKLLHAILTKTFTVEAPATPVTLVNAAGVNVNDFLLELRKVPKPILDAFNAAGWTYRIDFDYIGELSGQLNISCIGATNYSRKTIYISEASATLHEFGHFLDGQMGFPAEHERLYLAEAQNSGLRDYAKTNAREYFADCFAYYITYEGNSEMLERLRKNAPQTCAYFEKLMPVWKDINVK